MVSLFLVCDGMKREPRRVLLLLSKFKLTLVALTTLINLTDDMLRQRIMTLFGNLADWEDSRLMYQNSNLIGIWMPGSFI